MNQITLTDMEYSNRKKKTKREEFLEAMKKIIPWSYWVDMIRPYYFNNKRGRRPIGIETMLRMYLMQVWFNLSDEGIEDSIYDSYAMRSFMHIDFNEQQVPDATTLLKFRHMLEKNKIGKKIFADVNTIHERPVSRATEDDLPEWGKPEQIKPKQEKPERENPEQVKPIQEKPGQGKPEQGKPAQLNTDPLNTDRLNTYQSIYPAEPEAAGCRDRMDGMELADAYREIIRENIEYSILIERYGEQRMDETVELMLEVVLSKRPYIRIAGDDFPREVVKSRFLKINSSHLEYVFGCIDRNTTKVGNIKAYLLAALYNAPATMDSYYRAEVSHDLYGT